MENKIVINRCEVQSGEGNKCASKGVAQIVVVMKQFFILSMGAIPYDKAL